MKLQGATASNKGHVRETNQDRAYYRGPIAVLADGMGGHKGGAEAAQLAVGEFEPVVEPLDPDNLVAMVEVANSNVHAQASSDPELYGMGTTLVALTLHEDNSMTVVNVGDSRAYWLRGKHMGQVTEDHSLVEDLVRQGRLTPEEAAVHPQRNILTRALGIAPEVEVDRFIVEVRAGDRLLLCSDGLFNEISEEDFKQILIDVEDPAAAAQALVDATLETPCRDNVTVAVVDIIEGTGELPIMAQAAETLDPIPDVDPPLDDTENVSIPIPVSAPANQLDADPKEAETDESQTGAKLARRSDGSIGSVSDALPATDEDPVDEGAPIDYEAARRTAHERLSGNHNSRMTKNQPGSVSESGEAESVAGSNVEAGETPDEEDVSAAEPTVEFIEAIGTEEPSEGVDTSEPSSTTKKRWPLLIAPLLAIGLVAGGYLGAQSYAKGSYFVAESDDGLAIFQGRRGGFLWFNPEAVESIPDRNIDNLADDSVSAMEANEYSSLKHARAAVAEFEDRNPEPLLDGESGPFPNDSNSTGTIKNRTTGNVSTNEDKVPPVDSNG